MSQDPVLVTGAAGFIGFALARRLLEGGRAVVGIDSVNDYYDPALKEARLAVLAAVSTISPFTRSISPTRKPTEAIFRDGEFGPVVHLAAQAGVRYSLQNPHAYLDANLSGFLNVLEGCRHRKTEHLVFASSSSVYGANTRLPFSVHDNVDHPISLYAATKKANELMAHAYSHLYGLPTTGLRFFTVYGPWGRPDMAMFIFAKAITEGQPIRLFNYGRMRRDFTYVDDVIEAVERIIGRCRRNRTPSRAGRRSRSRRPAPRRGASTISATIAPSRFPASSSFWSRNSAARRKPSWCRCSPATCRKPAPMSTISCATSVSGRRRRSKKGCAISSPGIAITTGDERRI